MVNWNYYKYLKILPALFIAGVIFYLSSLSNPLPLPPSDEPPRFFDINPLLHAAEYSIFAFSVAFGCFPKIKNKYILLVGIIYAISDEIHQFFVPNRYFDIQDIIVDTIGVILGLLTYTLLFYSKERLKKVENDYIDD
ncbi:MAG: VanZ family protein [Promethearchaeota archaeon]